MDARAKRLTHFGIGKEEAIALVDAGYDLPRKIKAAKDSDLKKVKGVDDKAVKEMRKRLKKK